jgi:hypothetical protein
VFEQQKEVTKSRKGLTMRKGLRWYFRNSLLLASSPDLIAQRVWYNTRRCISDTSSLFGYYNYPYHIIFIAGMAMSASTWMKNLLARIPGYYMRATPMPWDVAVYQNICDSAFKYTPKHGYTLFKTHLNPTQENLECILQNGVEKVLITYRDFRDAVIAHYHRMMEVPHPPDHPSYVDYGTMSKEKAMDHNIEIIASDLVPWVRGWFEIASKNPEQYLFIKFEDLKNDTMGEFGKVLQFYGINLPKEKIEEIIVATKGRRNMQKNMAAARILPVGRSSNFRSGKIGSWKNELTSAQIEKCKKLLGPALIELGYEKDLNW